MISSIKSLYSSKWSKAVQLLIKVMVFTAASYYVWIKVVQFQSLKSSPFEHIDFSTNFNLLLFGVLIVLMVVNWGIEGVKWKLLVEPIEQISFLKAFRAVVSGITFGSFSPFSIGDFVGRILYLEGENRSKGVILSLVNGISQSLVTLTIGVIAFYFYLNFVAQDALNASTTYVIQSFLLSTLVVALIFYFNLGAISIKVFQYSKIKRWKWVAELVDGQSSRLLINLLALGLVRFAVFVTQYLVVFRMIQLQLPLAHQTIGVCVSLFTASLVPMLPLPSLVLRESLAMGFFEVFTDNVFLVGLAVFVVWFINIAIPSLVGALLFFGVRIFRR